MKLLNVLRLFLDLLNQISDQQLDIRSGLLLREAESRTTGEHAKIAGRVTVPHPKRDIPPGTLKSIENNPG
jgi:hypothetical protein